MCMEYCNERLTNASGMAAFRTICQEIGALKLPILNKYLPTSNDGFLPAEFAKKMLEELDILQTMQTKERRIYLQEVNRNEVVYSTNVNYANTFMFLAKEKLNCGIEKNGFYVSKQYKFLKRELEEKIWQSKSFYQKRDREGQFYFEDKTDGSQLKLNINLMPLEKNNNDFFEFEIFEKQATLADEYAYIIRPLLRLGKASIETGNPIVWT